MAGRYFDAVDLTLVLVGNVKEFRAAIRTRHFPLRSTTSWLSTVRSIS